MNAARRRHRLFLDHKPPLVAFAVVAIGCALMMVHVARSEAASGWLRAGLGGDVAQRVVEATLLEPDPATGALTEAARPLTAATPSDTPDSGGASAPEDSGSPSVRAPHGQRAGVDVGVVDPGPRGGADQAESPAGSTGAESTDDGVTVPGPAKGHQARGQGRDDQAVSDVLVPGASQGPDPRSHYGGRDDWPGHHGDRGDNDHGDNGRGHGHGNGDRGNDDRGNDDRGKGHGGGHGGGHGHGHGGGHGHGHGGGHGHGHGHR